MGAEPNVELLDLPVNLRGKYQSYTCARMDKAREESFAAPPTGLADGLRPYVRDYLDAADPHC